RRSFDGAERVLNRLGEGELLGDLALFRKGPRSASAVATAETELLVIKDERLEWLIRNRPPPPPHPRASDAPGEAGRPRPQGARGARKSQMTPGARRRASSPCDSPS